MKTNMHRNRGISLIELLIAFAFTSILMSFTLPASLDQAIRAKAGVGLSLVSLPDQAPNRTCEANRATETENSAEAGQSLLPAPENKAAPVIPAANEAGLSRDVDGNEQPHASSPDCSARPARLTASH